MKNVFTADQFIPTKWDTSKQKARFANHLIKFIQKDFPQSLFPKWFYSRLSMTFGHIAHYNLLGFYDHFFTSEEGKQEFIQTLMNHPCYGDPEYTYSDVEKAIQEYFRLAPRS